jgi:hypothetical protein
MKTKRLITAGLVVTVIGLSSAFADKIAEYTFSDKTFPSRSSDAEPFSSADKITAGGGVDASVISFSNLGASTPSLLLSKSGFYQSSEGGAISGKDYLGFSVKLKEGYQAAFSKITFYTLRRDFNAEGDCAPDNFSIYTSADNFKSPVGSGAIELKQGDNRSFSQHSADLSSLDSLRAVTGSVEFRIFFWVTQGIGEPAQLLFRLDDISVYATVSPAGDK